MSCRSYLAILAVAGLPAVTQAQVTFNGHTYQLTTSAGSWTAAEAQAVSLGGHLVAINDAAEQTFIQNTFLTASASTAVPYWIGLQRDSQPNGSFSTWSTGEAVTYTNWNAGEPNNTGGNEGYAAINWHYSLNNGSALGTWNDTPLAGSTGYGGLSDGPYVGIVEIAPVPEPVTSGLCAVVGLGAVRLVRRRVV